MGTSIARGEGFGGVPLTVVRDFARRIERVRSLNDIAASRLLNMDLPTAIALRNELRRQGFLEAHGPRNERISESSSRTFGRLRTIDDHFRTEAGQALCRASFLRRLHPDEARERLKPILERAQRWNDDPETGSIVRVKKLWLFGSMVKGRETVGDIDIAIEQETPETSRERLSRMDREDLRTFVDRLTKDGFYDRSEAEEWKPKIDFILEALKHTLYNGRMDPYVNETYVRTLVDMAEPCQLLLDDEKGILHKPEILSKHPAATTRAAYLGQPLSMPQLEIMDEPAALDLTGINGYTVQRAASRLGAYRDSECILHNRAWLHDRTVQPSEKEFIAELGPNDFAIMGRKEDNYLTTLRMTQEWSIQDGMASTVLHVDLDDEMDLEHPDALQIALAIALATSSLAQSSIRFSHASETSISIDAGSAIPESVIAFLAWFKANEPSIFVNGPNLKEVMKSRVETIRDDQLTVDLGHSIFKMQNRHNSQTVPTGNRF